MQNAQDEDRVMDLAPRPFVQALGLARTRVADATQDLLRTRGLHPDLTEAMEYALTGGKALRAFLVFESARMNGVAWNDAWMAAMAVECIHAYSLAHDDLPCMDDDDLRRGRPTLHRKWNEHTAVLAGDALQALAFELLSYPLAYEPAVAGKLVHGLAKAAGHRGMVGGQMLDIEAETSTTPATLDQIMAVQQGKTGEIIRWSATAGAVLSDADYMKWDALDRYGAALGLAFQIWDDVLDVEGDAAKTGKAVGKDADAGKATFVSLLGLDAAKARAEELVHEACTALSVYGNDAECLREAARFVISREN